MHLNAAGSAAMGFATVSVDGAVPAALAAQSAGNPDGPCWLSATELAYQNFTVGALVEKYNVSSTARTTLTANAANLVAAGANIWGAGLKSSPSTLRSNVPGMTGPVSGAYLGDVSNAGELVVITAYPSNVGLTVYSAAGAVLLALPSVTITPMSGTASLRLRDSLLVYIDSSLGWRMANVLGGDFAYRPRINEPINWTVPVTTASGKTFVLEVSDRITVRPADQSKGWQLKPTGTLTFNPDVMEVSAGVLRIGWSANAGESADALNLLDLTLATGATRNGVVVASAIVWTDGPTLNLTTFQVGPLQGNSATSVVIPSQRQPFVDKNDTITKPWLQVIANTGAATNTNTTAIAALPPVTLPPPGFGTVVAGSPVSATMGNDTLTLTSADGSVQVTGLPLSKTVDLSVVASAVAGAFGPPGMDGEDGEPALVLLQSVTTGGSTGSWIPLVDGSEPPNFITDGAGALIVVAYP